MTTPEAQPVDDDEVIPDPPAVPTPTRRQMMTRFCRLLGWDVDRNAVLVRENADYGRPGQPATLGTAVTYPDMAQRAVYDVIGWYRQYAALGAEAGPQPQFEPGPYGDGQRTFAETTYGFVRAGAQLADVEAAMTEASASVSAGAVGAPGHRHTVERITV